MSRRPLTGWQRTLLVMAGVFAIVLVASNQRHVFTPAAEDDVVRASVAAPGIPTGPVLDGCPVLPADNVWNTPVDKLPLDAHSAAYIQSMNGGLKLHPDFGADPNNGIPFALVPPNTRRVKVDFQYRDDSDLGNYPVPPNAPIEGGPNGTGDRHVILLEPDRCLLYELFDAHPNNDGSWKAGSGVKIDLTSNALRDDGKTSADAAGLPILPGLVRYDEVEAGEIRHALRFTVPKTRNAHIWPARHDASHNGGANFPPMGLRLRLKADFDVSSYSKGDQVILRALQRYGMILADNGSAWFISGVPDRRWDDDDLHHLGNVKGSDFEVVDETGLQMLSDSGRVDPRAVSH